MSLLRPDERHDLLIASLSFAPSSESVSNLRRSIFTESGSLNGLLKAAALRHLLMASIDGLATKGIIHPDPETHAVHGSLRSQLHKIYSRWNWRREEMRAGVENIIRALNYARIEPLILKGAVSLLTGLPPWRHQGDIDFAIEPAQSSATVEALCGMGYFADPYYRVKAHHHHLHPMIKLGFPASVEPHIRLMGKRGERIIDEKALRLRSVRVEANGLRFRLLRNDDFVLYGLIHHHFQNTGSIYGVISMRGLYEFCHALQALNDEDIENLLNTLRRKPRLQAAFDLWTATGEILFSFPIAPVFAPGCFARKRASAVSKRIEKGYVATRWRALYEDISGSFAVVSDYESNENADKRLLVTTPLAESLSKRGLWVRKSKKQKISGIF